ncbi:uncharacterized protein [Pyrus communis]|uniref:uncharacterized protein n=1 Tax=Pyrus communis TaxID=23211 RepID=UPI0035C163EA
MTKQEWAEPYIPVKSSKLWLRSASLAVQETLIEAGNNENDAFGAMGFLPQQKITATLRMLAYGASADQVVEITRMGKSTILKSLMRFCGAIESIYTTEYLQKPTNMDLQRLLKKAEMRGFLGMIGSIGCMHWTWKNCPSAWQGLWGQKNEQKGIILEAVASFDTWI